MIPTNSRFFLKICQENSATEVVGITIDGNTKHGGKIHNTAEYSGSTAASTSKPPAASKANKISLICQSTHSYLRYFLTI